MILHHFYDNFTLPLQNFYDAYHGTCHTPDNGGIDPAPVSKLDNPIDTNGCAERSSRERRVSGGARALI